ncbi:MAG: hypothetical protein NTY81_00145, partial [Candidatus Staskawiczbacteria bacterium]|nr:hypothetical protein [Candidatus Staskawiczbacteria bacterium]
GASNASCTYTIQSSDGYGSKNYFGYIVDNHGFSSISNPISGTFVIPIYGSQSGNGLTFKGNIKMKGNLTIAAWACGNTLTDSRDSQSYATVKIGTQCWMAANMNVGAMVDVAQDQADNGTIEKYCYDNSTGNCTTYGGLYQWPEALQYNNGVTLTSGSPAGGNIRGICPIGWHIPNDTEFTTLSTYLGGDTVSGGHLKEAGTAHWTTPNTGADNSSGFTGLTTGRRNTSGGTDKLGEYGIYWSTLPQGATAAYELLLRYNTATYLLNNDDRSLGGAVRCLKD